VEVAYEPIPPDLYSPLVGQVVAACLTADPTQRPDTVKVYTGLDRLSCSCSPGALYASILSLVYNISLS